jgi:hypothetical protein
MQAVIQPSDSHTFDTYSSTGDAPNAEMSFKPYCCIVSEPAANADPDGSDRINPSYIKRTFLSFCMRIH